MQFVCRAELCNKYFDKCFRWHSFAQSASQHNYNTTLFRKSQKVNGDFTNISLFIAVWLPDNKK